MKALKKIAALTLAVACVMSIAVVGASAATTSNVNGQIYVKAGDNYLKGKTVYFTTTSILPVIPNTDTDSVKTEDTDTITITVPVVNSIFKFVGFGKDSNGDIQTTGTTTFNGETITAEVTATTEVSGVDDESVEVATEVTFTLPFDLGTTYVGQELSFPGCVAYAMPSVQTGSNAGEHTFNVTVALNG